VSYPTAWALHHKINHAMAAREGCHKLSGAVQVDDVSDRHKPATRGSAYTGQLSR
jgi:hypothetical protein